MGGWKEPISLRVRRALREELETIAVRERRTLGNLGELVLEWAYAQLKRAGTTERLLQCQIRPSAESTLQNGNALSAQRNVTNGQTQSTAVPVRARGCLEGAKGGR
jgi:hypothetical protein